MGVGIVTVIPVPCGAHPVHEMQDAVLADKSTEFVLLLLGLRFLWASPTT